jgi:ankyrin repeat protein
MSTPLYLAAKHGRPQTVKPLLANCSSLNAVNMYLDTPPHKAVNYGHTEAERLLFEMRYLIVGSCCLILLKQSPTIKPTRNKSLTV